MIQKLISPQSLGQAIRDKRKQQRLSQKALGLRVGMGQPTVSKVEGGKPGTELDTVFRLLSALDLDLFLQERHPQAVQTQGDDW